MHVNAADVARGLSSEVRTTNPSTELNRCRFLLEISRRGTCSGRDFNRTCMSFLIDSAYSERTEYNDLYVAELNSDRTSSGRSIRSVDKSLSKIRRSS